MAFAHQTRGKRSDQRCKLRGKMAYKLDMLSQGFGLLLAELAQRAPGDRHPRDNSRLAAAQRRDSLLAQKREIVALEQDMTRAIFDDVKSTQTRDRKDAIMLRWRADQKKLRVVALGDANIPGARFSHCDCIGGHRHELLKLNSLPASVLRRAREHHHSHRFTSKRSLCSSGS